VHLLMLDGLVVLHSYGYGAAVAAHRTYTVYACIRDYMISYIVYRFLDTILILE
jgi:hypothetical protein